jgi:hypothetical protein
MPGSGPTFVGIAKDDRPDVGLGYPNEELKAGCLALYENEKAQGTELPAIIGALREYIELEGDRLRSERDETYRRNREAERVRLEEKFLSGADSGWTPVKGSVDLYCRRNGRAFRIARGKDKRWKLYRIKGIEDPGDLLGNRAGTLTKRIYGNHFDFRIE